MCVDQTPALASDRQQRRCQISLTSYPLLREESHPLLSSNDCPFAHGAAATLLVVLAGCGGAATSPSTTAITTATTTSSTRAITPGVTTPVEPFASPDAPQRELLPPVPSAVRASEIEPATNPPGGYFRFRVRMDLADGCLAPIHGPAESGR